MKFKTLINISVVLFLFLFFSIPLTSMAITGNGYYHKETGSNFSFFDGMAEYKTPIIDGVIGENEWNTDLSRNIYKYDRDDNRIRYMFQYDSTNLYILIQVDDDHIWSDSGLPDEPWVTNQDDGVEIYIDPNNSRDAVLMDTDRVIAFTVMGNSYRFDQGNNAGSTTYYGDISLIQRAVKINGTVNNPSDTDIGYVVETAIPWAHLGGVIPTAGYISLNIVVTEDDDGGPLSPNYDDSNWDQPFEVDRYFKWFADGLRGPANYARIYFLQNNDTVAPSTISNVALKNASPYSAMLTFTAPGDNLNVGESVKYQIRYSKNTAISTETEWNEATIFQDYGP